MKTLEIRDNPECADRYTVVYDTKDRQGFHDAVGMNHAPFHPLGIGMHCSAMPGEHLGKKIRFEDLPEDCQRLVRQDLAEAEAQS